MTKNRNLARFFQLFVGIMLIPSTSLIGMNSQKYYLGSTYLAESDFDLRRIKDSDIHYGWDLGYFFINGYTKVIDEPNKPLVFLKNTGDKIALWFQLKQDINSLNKNEALSIDDGGANKRDTGKGTLCINYVDYQNFSHLTPYTDYLKALSVGADTNIRFFEEGDYVVTLDYRIRKDNFLFWDSRTDYRILFWFSVRNGNCMIFLRDLQTHDELTTSAPNGFYLDLTKSRYLDINVKKEILEDNSDKLDVRFNKPAKDGDRYTEEGVYTITLKNRYTNEVTTKVIAVGNDPILNAYASTLMPISKIKKQMQKAKNAADKNQIKVSLKDASNNIKMKIHVGPYQKGIIEKSDEPKDASSPVNEEPKDTSSPTTEVISAPIIEENNHKEEIRNNSNSLKQLSSIQESVRECLSKDLDNKDYKIEKVEVKYISQEYIEELEYNSLPNNYFGHSLREIEEQFGDEKYIFTLGNDNKTEVHAFKNSEDIFGKVITDIAIGSGVILVSATISLATGGTIGVVFAAAAKTGAYAAFSSAFCSSVIAGAVTGINTKNFDETKKAMIVAGAEGFKWGAIAGAVAGGAMKAWKLHNVAAQNLAQTTAEANTVPATSTQNVMKSSSALAIPAAQKGKEAVDRAQRMFYPNARKEVSFKDGVEVPYGTPGSTRVDIGQQAENGQWITAEVKSYTEDYNSPKILSRLKEALAPALKDRLENLPKGSIQELVLDVKGKNYSPEETEQLISKIQDMFSDIYPNMPVRCMQ